MATKTPQPWAREAWALSRRQHGVVTRRQLLGLGMPASAIRHRLATGRLHRLHQGVYAVGRAEVSRFGQLLAAVLACGEGARLSHRSGAELFGIRKRHEGPIEVTVPAKATRRRPGIKLHRRASLKPPRLLQGTIPVNDPVSILVDLATCLSTDGVEDAVNEADRLGLVATDRLPALLDSQPRRPGRGRLRRILAAQTFSRAQTALERRFLPIARAAGLPAPTAQAHARRGLRTLRFSHSQVFHQPAHVRQVLADAIRHLG